MDIVEIPELPPQIKRAAEIGELVIFIGAGMSYELDCADWATLAKNLSENVKTPWGQMNHY